ncbi:hypothetical protein GQ55_5G169600 [Panicum hallii var. hallii]|uniref:Uncharacterized protein n=1 Tax=Panicum hallii var. hallii TaxID=1504633 RepID=A0A2T7DH50_9POAL|nr:hypothetical protein GQ55_5G169600 [Panicum hallii var. hallii]
MSGCSNGICIQGIVSSCATCKAMWCLSMSRTRGRNSDSRECASSHRLHQTFFRFPIRSEHHFCLHASEVRTLHVDRSSKANHAAGAL